MDAVARSSVPELGSLVAGRYRIGRAIGEGGMGVVLAARDEKTSADVAIKLLQTLGAANTERFLREARLVSKIDSDHVVRVLDTGSLDGHPFLVMERLRGEDFGAKIRGGRLPLVEVADCMVQTCEALAHAHGAGIIHRDIKASNLFEHEEVGGPRIVKVLDFGISKSLGTDGVGERTLTRTRDGGFLGSPPYMSPEHIRDPRHVDGRADLWSLGVVAYRLLTTDYPFDGESTGEVLVAILEKRPPRFRDLGVEVPDEVERIILKCLARTREDRFPDAGALAAAFAPYTSPHLRTYGERVKAVVQRAPAPVLSRPTGVAVADPSTRTVPPPKADDPATTPNPPSEGDLPTTTADPRAAIPQLLPADEPMPSVTKLLVQPPPAPPRTLPLPTPAIAVSAPGPSVAIDLPIVSPRRPSKLPVVLVGFLGALAVGFLVIFSAAKLRSSVTLPAPVSPSAATPAAPAPQPPAEPATSVAAPVPSSPPAPPSASAPTRNGKPRPGGRPGRPAPTTPEPKVTPPPTPTKKPELQPNPYPDL